MHLSLARNFAKGIDPGKRAWIPPAEAITVPAEDTHNQLGEACIDMLRGPGTTGGVTTGSKLVIRGIPPTAMGACPGQGSVRDHGLNLFRTSLQMDTYLAEGGFPMSHSQSWRREFRWTRSSFLVPSRDARHRWRRCIAACPPRRWESARGPFP